MLNYEGKQKSADSAKSFKFTNIHDDEFRNGSLAGERKIPNIC